MVDMLSDLRMQDMIIYCDNTQKNKMFNINFSLFRKKCSLLNRIIVRVWFKVELHGQ